MTAPENRLRDDPYRPSVRATITVSNASTRALLAFCVARGVNTERLATRTGPLEERGRLTAELMFAVWDEAERETGDELIGVHAAEFVPMGAYGPLDYLMMSSSSAAESFAAIARHFHLGNGGAELRLHNLRRATALQLHALRTPPEHLPRSVQYTFAVLLLRSHLATGVAWRPREVHFTFAQPADPSELERIFAAPLRFEQPIDQVIVDDSALHLPHRSADPVLHEELKEEVGRATAALDAERFREECRAAVEEALRRGDPSVRFVAAGLAVSPRTLQRRLNAGGFSYRSVLDSVRREKSIAALERGDHVADLAQALGFTEQRVFYRAFRRWTGATPVRFITSRARHPEDWRK